MLGLFDDAATESQAKVALVTAPAGAGKSRIRHELCARLSKRDEPPMILIGRCDAMSAGAPFSAIGDAIRRHAGIVEGSTDAERKIKAGAVEIDGERHTSLTVVIPPGGAIFRVGKKWKRIVP